jgi:hypothetical protein
MWVNTSIPVDFLPCQPKTHTFCHYGVFGCPIRELCAQSNTLRMIRAHNNGKYRSQPIPNRGKEMMLAELEVRIYSDEKNVF